MESYELASTTEAVAVRRPTTSHKSPGARSDPFHMQEQPRKLGRGSIITEQGDCISPCDYRVHAADLWLIQDAGRDAQISIQPLFQIYVPDQAWQDAPDPKVPCASAGAWPSAYSSTERCWHATAGGQRPELSRDSERGAAGSGLGMREGGADAAGSVATIIGYA